MPSSFDDVKAGPFQQSSIQGGLPKLVRIWEYLRDLNSGGYGSGILTTMKNGPAARGNGTTSCSPFTATCIYMALDPRDVDTSKPYALDGPYDPRFDGGRVLGPYFYALHNGYRTSEFLTKGGKWRPDFKSEYVDRFTDWNLTDAHQFALFSSSGVSVVTHNLGFAVDERKMRRGDMVAINWSNKGGHATFCWNVHLDKNGDVDCFQPLSSNSTGPLAGVSVVQHPIDDRYLEVKNGKFHKKKDMFVGILDDAKAYPEYAAFPYPWYTVRKLKKSNIDLDSFGVPKEHVWIIEYGDAKATSVDSVNVARLYGVTPPDPYLQSTKTAAAPAPPKPPPIAKVKSKPVPLKPAPAPQQKPAEQKPPEKVPAKQQPNNGLDVEADLQMLWATRWISKDPGKSANVNDAESQAAIADFQDRYMKGEKIPGRGHADPATRKRLSKYASWAKSTPLVNLALAALHDHGSIEHAPGSDIFKLDGSIAAVKDFQGKHKLDVDGIPGAQTQQALLEAMKQLGQATSGSAKSAPAPAKPAGAAKNKDPAVKTIYFARNYGLAGDKVNVVVVARNCEGMSFAIGLYRDGKPLQENAGSATIAGGQGRLEVQIPADLSPAAKVEARLSGSGLSAATAVPFEIESAEEAEADWRPYIGKDSVPDAVLNAVRKNRARYPMRDLNAKGAADHYDYKPPDDQYQWAVDYFKKKRDSAPSELVWKAFLEMLDAEGRPSSIQTYDDQIVTWGVGFGGKGNGVDVFANLDKDAKSKKLLDGIGIDYDASTADYHVVDLAQKKVVSSAKGERGDDDRHVVALKAWRRQPDLLNAIVGISEDPATREAVADAQWAVYLKTCSKWGGQDKIATPALFFMVAHLHAWLPAVANGVNVSAEFDALQAGAPSIETDKKLAPRIAHAFLRSWKSYFDAAQRKNPKKWTQAVYDDIHTRTKTHVWERLRHDAKRDHWDPGSLEYETGF